jgi:hypothetical protein
MKSIIGWTVFGSIIGALVTLLFIPVTNFLGYTVTGYLSKDLITIEQVDLFPETNRLPLPHEELRRLLETVNFRVYLLIIGETQYNTLSPRLYYLDEEQSTGRRLREELHEEEVKEIVNLIKGFINFNDDLDIQVKGYIKRLQEYKEGDHIDDIIAWAQTAERMISTAVITDNIQVIPYLQTFLRTASITIPVARKRALELLNVLQEFQPKRTGMLQIRITLLNSGDTDGLIRQEGQLILVNEGRKIPIRITSTSKVSKIEKKSMSQVMFKPNEGKATQDDVRLLKGLLLQGYSSQVRIEVNDIRDKPIHSKIHTLPVSSGK